MGKKILTKAEAESFSEALTKVFSAAEVPDASLLTDLLTRIATFQVTVAVLEQTVIVKAVNKIRKQAGASEGHKGQARAIVRGWKLLFDRSRGGGGGVGGGSGSSSGGRSDSQLSTSGHPPQQLQQQLLPALPDEMWILALGWLRRSELGAAQ